MTTYSPKIDPFNRWLVRPVTKAMVFFLAGLILNYIILCLWDAYAWSTEISSTYGLLIIRAIVVIILAIVDLIALPFRAWDVVAFTFQNCAILFPILGILYGVSVSPAQSNDRKISATALFFLGILVLTIIYWYSVLSDGYTGSFLQYILSSEFLLLVFVTATICWLMAASTTTNKQV